jgi:ParB-like chromosome segregation protein Spo0J
MVRRVTADVILGIDDVQVLEHLYPRLRPVEMLIQQYMDNVDAAPAIVVARGCILVDGYHRWQAHKRNGATEVRALDLGDMSDEDILAEAIRLNARHGWSLTPEEKRHLAPILVDSQKKTIGDAARCLAVSERSVLSWLAAHRSEAVRKAKAEAAAERARKIAEAEQLRAEGLTQQQIAERLGVKQPAVSKLFRGAKLHPGISGPDTLAPATDPKPEPTAPKPEPQRQPEPLDDETRRYLELWDDEGDLVANVESGRMTVAEAVKHAQTAERLYQNSDKHSPFKARGEANKELKIGLDLISNFLDVRDVALTADDDRLWRLVRIVAPKAIERLNEWKEAADGHLA